MNVQKHHHNIIQAVEMLLGDKLTEHYSHLTEEDLDYVNSWLGTLDPEVFKGWFTQAMAFSCTSSMLTPLISDCITELYYANTK